MGGLWSAGPAVLGSCKPTADGCRDDAQCLGDVALMPPSLLQVQRPQPEPLAPFFSEEVRRIYSPVLVVTMLHIEGAGHARMLDASLATPFAVG
jgi:hypothetical protein